MSTARIVASKYCLLYELGRGGMGSVWLAEHLTLRSRVAVKLIDPKLATSPQALARFEREARAAAALRS
ncbi:MAG TPA: serine/threonine protein kinase, partial [Polyangiaceae bacterium]|nr:serine/threonine protein kinase [Polyangiaceae bacterium]